MNIFEAKDYLERMIETNNDPIRLRIVKEENIRACLVGEYTKKIKAKHPKGMFIDFLAEKGDISKGRVDEFFQKLKPFE
ncbi:hypothetical protein [Sporolactobacillus terrae]|uniref:hypothetical protein n=1 Tax=Sporolactobacillus terrae TaxID=269673 RepID=UPI00048AF0BB|nr:hypothetical protein [Sporolactobacillus terrae]